MFARYKSELKQLSLKSCLYSALGGAILGIGLMEIHSLSGITEGGALGLTLLLNYWFHISPSITGFIANVFCYILGFRIFGIRFMVYSLISAACFSLGYGICEQFPPIYPGIADLPLLAAVLGAVFVGVGVGICVRAGGAPTGDDALAMSLSKITGMKIELMYLVMDITVLGLSLCYIPLSKIVYSLVTVILSGRIIGWIERYGSKKKS